MSWFRCSETSSGMSTAAALRQSPFPAPLTPHRALKSSGRSSSLVRHMIALIGFPLT